EFDLELVVPDPQLSLQEGAVAPWKGLKAKGLQAVNEQLQPFLDKYRIDGDTPLSQLRPAVWEKLVRGDGKKFPGVLNL
ncbi:MAG: hypothetical protein GTO03_12155, partial [Planctomycetales bacterium]|nr:hypothetical protein [Planctomycetales bacterium]